MVGVKGMEMPKSCLTCRFLDYSRGYYRCMIDQILIGSLRTTGRRDNCPLIPMETVPDANILSSTTAIRTNWESGR